MLTSLITAVISFSLSLASTVILILSYSNLPEKLPLFYSLVWGERRLIPTPYLFVFPAAAILFTCINISLSRKVKKHAFKNQPVNIYWLLLLLAVVTALLLNFGLLFSIVTVTPSLNPLFGSIFEPLLVQVPFFEIVPPFAVALAVSFLTTPFVIAACLFLGIVDDPEREHPAILHNKKISRGGAVPVFLGLLVSTILFLDLSKSVVGMLVAAGFAVTVGVLDDKWDINPYLRFLSQLLLVTVIIVSGIGISFVNNPLNGVIRLDQIDLAFNFYGEHHILLPADIITAFWIIFAANMISWSNGVDGQFPGIVSIAAAVIGMLSLRFVGYEPAQIVPAKISFATAGAVLGTLPFVWHRARIFYGFGATSLGIVLAVLSIMTGAKLATAVLILLVPILDSLAAVSRRLLRGQSPFWGDSEHLHHQLLHRGWTQQQVALLYWVLTAVSGAVALLTAGKSKALAILSGAVVVGLILVFFNSALFLKKSQK